MNKFSRAFQQIDQNIKTLEQPTLIDREVKEIEELLAAK
jgi:hypothetical protein